MRLNPIPLIAALLLVVSVDSLHGQQQYSIQLKSGTIVPSKNITAEQMERLNQSVSRIAGKTSVIIQFEQLLADAEKNELKNAGVELHDYIPSFAYTASIYGSINIGTLNKYKARSVFELSPAQKMDAELAAGIFPARAVKVYGMVDVWISWPRSFDQSIVVNELRSRNIEITSSVYSAYRILSVRVPQQQITELAALPFVEFVQAAPGEPQLLNNNSRANSRANVLTASSGIGRNIKGEGVTIGIGDDADPQHVDITGRKINHTHGFYDYHGTHVTGIAAGGGIWNELYTGHAPKVRVVSQIMQGIINNSPSYVSDYGMVVTNNSWGLIAECGYMGQYDFYSAIADQQAIALPNLQHVFAAGNSGGTTCSPYPASYKTVLNAFQSSKNVITVGNMFVNGNIAPGSSRGPVHDGRIKPEIVSQGRDVWSSANFVDYWANSGTSMAAPSVSGGLALLYQRYRQLNASANPLNGLMKAIVCNSANDYGNPGPDFTYGFGVLNLLRSVETIENNRYFIDNITTGAVKTHNIVVPANTAALKVMLYWNDPAASAVVSKALVNDLDLTVTTSTPAATYQPLILDPSPTNVTANAVPGVDTLNNIEQVTISNPAAGTYTVNVNGTAVPVSSPQQYFVAYDIVPVSTTLTQPAGGEKLLPGENVLLMWDSYGGNAETFTAEYSLDNGGSWVTISNSISSSLRQYTWTVPSAATNQALIRLTKNNTAQVSISAVFTIIGAPALQLAPEAEQCEGYIKLNWTAAPNATQYEVMKLQGDEMQSVAILPNTTFSYTFSGLSKDSVYWVTTRAIYNGNPGRRDSAVYRQPNTGSCSGSISDNDIAMTAVLSPASSGRLLTSTALSNAVPLTVRIKNLDDNTSNATLTFSYSINGGTPVTDAAVTPAINAGATYDYTFAAPIDLSAAGTYNIHFEVARTGGDPVAYNDTLLVQIKQLNNPAVTLPFTDDIEATANQLVLVRQMGLQGADRYDFANSTAAGRLRTFISTGMAYSGTKAITLDADKYNAGTSDTLTATFNLAAYDATTQDLRLDFRYKNHGQGSHATNKVWIRGSDVNNWIEAFDLAANQSEVDGSYKLSSSLQVSDLLKNAIPAQNFSTSFQVRWGQYGQYSAADNSGYAGYSFDDIKLYTATDDMQLLSIDTPVVNSCNLGAAVPVKITVRNNSEAALANVPVQYSINGGAPVIETITASIPANSNYQYTFTATANLSANGTYLLAARVAQTTDSYDVNDTLSRTVINTLLITVTNASPYLEQFEANNGNWYTGGKNSSWEYGTPATYKLTRAANGTKAWKTGIQSKYKDAELSYLYSPCFDISAVTSPALSMSLSLDMEDCGVNFCDGAYMEYSKDGSTWSRLGANGQGTNWYNKAYSSNNLWSAQNYYRWHVATLPLSVLPAPLSQYTRIQFRFVVSSDASVNREGIAIDDIHIYSNPYGIYDGTGASPVVNQPVVNGTNWVNFTEGVTGKIIASAKPDGQNLGSTDVQSFVNTSGVRTNSGQYYHDRNITIKPTNNTLADSCTVRFYFLDSETEALINATGCTPCYKPAMAYELGVSKYSDPNDFYEDGVVENGVSGTWLFINSSKVQKIPYDKGYYAEFRVKDFSEFWLNNGGFTGDHPLPLQLISFTASKAANGNDAVLNWTTASEFDINRFDIEVAKGNEAFRNNSFLKIGSVLSQGNATGEQYYSFTDIETGKTGVWYYRLKILERDGSFSYSDIKPVVFSNEVKWQVTPNPSDGIFQLSYQESRDEPVNVKLVDATGRTVKQFRLTGNGFPQKQVIDLSGNSYAKGLYLLNVTSAAGHQSFTLLKQ